MISRDSALIYFVALLAAAALSAQEHTAPAAGETRSQPLYKVTIVSRTTKAINYGYLSAPTQIGFAGTPLLAGARGEAAIKPDKGATAIRARFSDVPAPSRFGPQYLTYVLWAISPEGRATNLGELVLNASNDGELNTSTALQTFALIVTAEPYFSVTQPSDIVVMENVLLQGTTGRVEEVNATYELLPRKSFTYDRSSAPAGQGKMVSQDEYEAILALYQAQNAIQIAEAQDAKHYAADRLSRARQLYDQARRYPKHLSREIVSMAREAAQVAEDARAISAKRAKAERAARQQEEIRQAEEAAAAARAEAEARAAAARATTPRPAAQSAERARRQIQPQPVTPAPAAQPQTTPITVDPGQFHRQRPESRQNRATILSQLQQRLDAADTPRGIVVTLPEPLPAISVLSARLSAIADAIRPHTDLHLKVEGHTDRVTGADDTGRRAAMVRTALIVAGVPSSIIVAQGHGDARPRAHNGTAEGRARNRRVEIVISGDAIGGVPTWDSTYTLLPRQP